PLAFATAYIGEADFANNIVLLKNAGCNVIVDDVIYLDEPFFQDGIVAQAVDTVVGAGTAYYSSAGNEGAEAFESKSWTETTIVQPVDGNTQNWYAFDGANDARQLITLGNGQSIFLIFQWDDPFYTQDGVQTDLDLYVVVAGTSNIVGESTDNNLM